MIVSKFGGTSMATHENICRVANIIKLNPKRKVVVVSAPGISSFYPTKITDQLLFGETGAVVDRFYRLYQECGVSPDYLCQKAKNLATVSTPERLAFGEHMSAYLLAQVLGWRFVDAKYIFSFDEKGKASTHVKWVHNAEQVVIPGFYGVYKDDIRTFPRGGSDISGALLAIKLQASVYENWTDVDGVYAKDPRIYKDQKPFPRLTYHEAFELFQSGACVLHPDAVAPVAKRGIPIHIRNTFNPTLPGTIILD